MTKTRFVKIINRLKEARQLQDNINDLMNKARDNIRHDFMNAASLMINYEDTVVELLEEVMDDDGSWISWWIYETNYGESRTKIYNNNDEVIADIKTPKDLYDYLCE